jgi:hypothetical protein
VEPPQNSLWLIFKIYWKFEKLLICYFYYSNSITYFDLNPGWLDGAFHELSKYIKFGKFGSVDFDLLKFEIDTSLQNKRKRIKLF